MTEAQLSTAVIENPEMLKYQRRQQQQQLDQKSGAARETGSAASVSGVVNGESLEDIRKVRVWPIDTENMSKCPRTGQGEQAVWIGHRHEWWGGRYVLSLAQDPGVSQLGSTWPVTLSCMKQ